jgi:hypothetical protein
MLMSKELTKENLDNLPQLNYKNPTEERAKFRNSLWLTGKKKDEFQKVAPLGFLEAALKKLGQDFTNTIANEELSER